jgi:FKBP-type peptidyl-prolyl cis-trans isomerase SlyD
MLIALDTVVAIDYTLKDDDGNIVDESEPGDPLFYLHGHQNIVEGLEEALTGHKVGDSLQVVVSPEKGYGTRDPQMVFDVPRDQLPDDAEPEVGMEMEMSDEDGMSIPVRISKVDVDSVEVDANHELADQTLHFSVTVREVRKATVTELEHGHVHGADDHHH